ncbi:unnamed protein product [Gongylonema pulchrum]|uniref:LIM zinc-binding domain-containing protein n=1 Tax=Gongylonema pulchrum TaxID=637853 RepID=A0A183F088_9BILA|nr:unnamed protein product [Gongylonema pulchrum]
MRQRRETDIEYQQMERIADAEAMRERRQTDIEYQEMERIADAEAKRQRRQTDIEYQQLERIANAEAMQQRRQTDYRESERLSDAEARQQRRAADPEFRERERGANAEAMRQRRQTSLEYSQNERKMNSESMRVRREENVEYRQREREANSEAMRIRRSTNETERERQENALRMQLCRSTGKIHEQEGIKDREAKQQKRTFTYTSGVEAYENAVKEGPTYTCNCCGRLEFRRSVSILKMSHLQQASSANKVPRNLIRNVFYLQQVEECFFCKTCVQSIKCWKQPRYCLSNELHFPIVDRRLQILGRQEERLVAACHIFQTI